MLLRVSTATLRVNMVLLVFVVLYMAFYSAFVLYLVGPQNDCLSVRDFTAQVRRHKLPIDANGLLEKLSANDEDDTDEGRLVEELDDCRRRPMMAERTVDESDTRGGSNRTRKKTKRHLFVHDSLPVTELLNSDYISNTVYYAWCGARWFEFHNYLSVRSVIRQLRPDTIVFLFDIEPVLDDWTYNTWYKELVDEYPFFWPYRVNPETQPLCLGHQQVNMTFVLWLLTLTGGFYVNEQTVLAGYPIEMRQLDLVVATDPTWLEYDGVIKVPSLLATKRGLPGFGPQSIEQRLADRSLRTRRLNCATIDGYVTANRKPACITISDESRPYPRDIWERADSFGRLARTIFYGTPAILRPTPSYDELVPNIAHIVWLGGGQMDFLFYLCVTSLVYVAKVDAVYIHGDGPPTGDYWNLIKDNPKVHLIHREYSRSIYGTTVEVVSHVTDVWRVDFMIKYGGIYVDTDTVFVRPLDRKIRGYDAVGSYDWTYWNHPFPDTINFGVALGKRNAPYWHKFQESMKWFKDGDWSWNGLRQPYRIQERHPDLVLIDPHLQVICYLALCHPTWFPDYHNESVHHLNSNRINNWRTDAYAFHWTLPTPDELKDHIAVLSVDTMFTEIGRFVLEKAGTLEYFKKLANSPTNNEPV